MANKIFENTYPNFAYQIWDDKPEIEFQHVHQVHGNDVIEYSDNCAELLKADGIILTTSPIALKTADCLPIIVEGDKLALVHAGWKGLENKIIQNAAIQKLNPKKFIIGPCISAENYEVGQEFKTYFPDSKSFIQKGEKLYFDLRLEITNQITSHYQDALIEQIPICTFQDPKYRSYRENKTDKRNWHILIPSL